MTGQTQTTTLAEGPSRRVRLERTYDVTPEDLWHLWTTKEGIESWWGPDGFYVTVHRLELRPGGLLDYTMTARGAEQIRFLQSIGRPLSTRSRATYTEVVPLQRLAYDHVVDFIPGTRPYDVSHVVELHAAPEGVRLVVTFDAMHDEQMTRFATMGWESEFEKLEASLKGGRCT